MARRFTFKLQVLLKVRRAEEERCQRAVAGRLSRVQGLEEERQQIRELGDQARAEAFRAASGQQLDVAELARQRYWAAQLQRRAWQSDVLFREQQRELAKERNALVRATTAVRMVEKLRERQLARHQVGEDRADRREMDDLAITQYRRRTED